ncbi:MAG: group II intron reverse transcriptase/maturase, partial [Prevotella sp.]|nr:group II intron reverse transcriptase/maturase [Prevotella sp.]
MRKRWWSGATAPWASLAMPNRWQSIDWKKCEAQVRKLQVRIVEALKANRAGKVKKLQRILVNSFAAKALAVRRVTSNRGGSTAGVDGETWLTPAERYRAISSLTLRGYKAKPLKRVEIPKSNGKMRPLGIPTIKDRAMQALFLMALEPVAETQADRHSYGFRRNRCCADATDQLYKVLFGRNAAQWVLEGDIKGCFDHISHEWLLQNVITDKKMLRKWLEAGVMIGNVFHDTDEGTPQGGIISPVLANITLDGMDALLDKYRARKQDGKTVSRKVNLVRYADDFIITGESREVLEEIKADLIPFLTERGLELSEEKTLITHIDDGFDFLGFNIRKYRNGTLLIKPSEKALKKFARATHEIIYSMRSRKQADVIERLNRMTAGWVRSALPLRSAKNYYRYVSSKKAFWRLDHTIFLQLRRWAIRRHQNKSLEWVRNKYWHKSGTRQWVYSTTRKDKKGKEYTLTLITLA